jgi:dolichol-phosphate mannosyltransferase
MTGTGEPTHTGGGQPVLSIILATLNESRNLPQVVDRIRGQPLPPFEVIVVDDGSTDGTRAYLQEAAAADPRIRPILHEGKQTTLRAQCQGIEAASGRLVIIMDADLQHPPEILPKMVRALEQGAKLVVASRYAPGGSAGPRTLSRWAISRGAEWTAKALLRPARHVTDPVSGYFGFRKETWVSLDPTHRGYKLLLFLLVMAGSGPVAEVGFRFEPRTEGSSKVTQTSGFIRMFLVEVVLARRLAAELRRSVAGRPKEQPL